MSHGLELLFLGSGNAFASGRYWGSFLLNGRLLFDASPVVLPHLKQSNVPPEDVEAVFISHFHADHFFGLPFLLLEYAEQSPRSEPLTIVGPPGIEERLRSIVAAGFPHLLENGIEPRETYIEMKDGFEGEIAGARLVARAVTHVDEFGCFGYRVQVDGGTVAYSGDSMMCDALVELADGADVFVVECTCWDGSCGPHLGPDDLRELRRKLGPKPAFVLTHLENGQQDIGIENSVVAEDLARFNF